jgi:choline-glycine betaine transporter
MGFVPGFLLTATLAILAARFFAMVISGLVGAVGLSLGGAALLAATPAASLINRSLTALPVAFILIVIGSVVTQLKLAPTEDEFARLRAGKQRRKQLKVEAMERDKRLKSYGKPK